jgi:antitoxin component of MazEF toxin-antitoxin module
VKAIQKIVRNGNSAQITIARSMLFKMNLRPGDLVEVRCDDDGEMHIRPWMNREYTKQASTGVLPEPPASLKP